MGRRRKAGVGAKGRERADSRRSKCECYGSKGKRVFPGWRCWRAVKPARTRSAGLDTDQHCVTRRPDKAKRSLGDVKKQRKRVRRKRNNNKQGKRKRRKKKKKRRRKDHACLRNSKLRPVPFLDKRDAGENDQ
ncbi:hypothetical protein H112_08175 [Trichophyton rubrum D6]|uniref:Uncharacterized protein n=2 Tax=Trichophyton TaxID=5550 RepID=A0A022VQ40_TRIRU|nr:hypothetical protein H100_08202 [Trichophyton rubrum MR850]EZF37458.1 hypothetical protein H102_08159 [Trichophyton rubrum CBS 100081]EZF48086.1 hypothetical protein H103_08186 [Trichophyton rubrum CBS 288.86]EZF58750.1 hypothetical protein H104_08135 [Trichophyton rubrum CBS 289.86]EZF69343.1 hypothetical protein H105_08186 [Trichophyton soudanense CBS 452.61]EZF80017.1 hypothetical protein H110_08181 [Trichophyton rubrum MR1448]EZG12211.1 hypothetical protein H107_08328 [Trichophyton rub